MLNLPVFFWLLVLCTVLLPGVMIYLFLCGPHGWPQVMAMHCENDVFQSIIFWLCHNVDDKPSNHAAPQVWWDKKNIPLEITGVLQHVEHHQPSLTIINHHQPSSSIIINHHYYPSFLSIIIIHYKSLSLNHFYHYFHHQPSLYNQHEHTSAVSPDFWGASGPWRRWKLRPSSFWPSFQMQMAEPMVNKLWNHPISGWTPHFS